MSYTGIKVISVSLFILFALFMSLLFRNYIVEKQSSGIDANISNTNQYIRKSVDFLINEKKQDYVTKSKIIFSDKVVLEALQNREREGFYQAVKSYYNRVQQSDKNFWGLHIILPNNLSFIRVHKPHVADKLIPKGAKPLIDKVNETHQQVTSFDAGKFGYFLRVVTPIYSLENTYLGVAEFSVNVDSLTQYIKTEFGYESLFLVRNLNNKAFLNSLPKTDNGLTHFKSTNAKLFSNYSSGIHNDNYFIHSQNRSYSTISVKLSESADLIVAFDVTEIINEKNLFENNINAMITIVILIFAVIWFFATLFYINNRRQTAIQLQKSHDIISENVIYSNTDLDGVITEVSDAFCRVSGHGREKLLGNTCNITKPSDIDSPTQEKLWKTIRADKIWQGEIKSRHSDGSVYWIDATISPRFDENRNKLGYMTIIQDITDKKVIETLSITDSLCDVYNRRHFDEVFQRYSMHRSGKTNKFVC